jgi:hypothetical protein
MPLPLISAVFPMVLSAIFIEADVFRTGWHGGRVCFVPCYKSLNPERTLSACFESSFDCDHGEEEFVWVILEGYKFMVKIEGASGLVQSFDYNANRRYLRRVSPTSMQRIHQEKATEVSAPARTADRQPAKQGGRKKRIPWKLPDDRLRQLTELNAIGRECVITENRTTGVDHHERCGNLSPGILASLKTDVAVEFRHA